MVRPIAKEGRPHATPEQVRKHWGSLALNRKKLGQMTAEEGQHAALAVELAGKAEEMDSIDQLWADLVAATDRLRPRLEEFLPS